MSEKITRKKHTGEPGNGGQFGSAQKSEPSILGSEDQTPSLNVTLEGSEYSIPGTLSSKDEFDNGVSIRTPTGHDAGWNGSFRIAMASLTDSICLDGPVEATVLVVDEQKDSGRRTWVDTYIRTRVTSADDWHIHLENGPSINLDDVQGISF